MSIQIRQLSYALGAEIIGLDIRKPLNEETFDQIHAAYLKHNILLFRGQSLTQEQFLSFVRRFGELESDDFETDDRLTASPQIQVKQKSARAGANARFWHTDRAFRCNPCSASVLYSVEMPDIGGDTMFANMYLAYETLSDGMKELIQGLFALHPGVGYSIEGNNDNKNFQIVAHPLVRVHPETGRKALYLQHKVRQFAGLTVEESLPFIQFLLEHSTRPQLVYRHQWRNEDLLMWDNRCSLHRSVGDYDMSKPRRLNKACVVGQPSGGYVYDPSKTKEKDVLAYTGM